MQFSEILGIVAGLGYIVAYLDYNRNVFRGVTKPNSSTWAIWSVISFISAGSYVGASEDWWKSVIPVLNIVFCIATFFLALFTGRLKRPDWFDLIALGIGLLAVAVWSVRRSAVDANFIVQFAIMAGFCPTWRGVWKDPGCEHPMPWSIWTVSYLVSIVVVILRWEGRWLDLFYPVSCTLLHGSVPVVSLYRLIILDHREELKSQLAEVQKKIAELSRETTARQVINATLATRVEHLVSEPWGERRCSRDQDVAAKVRELALLRSDEANLEEMLGVKGSK